MSARWFRDRRIVAVVVTTLVIVAGSLGVIFGVLQPGGKKGDKPSQAMGDVPGAVLAGLSPTPSPSVTATATPTSTLSATPPRTTTRTGPARDQVGPTIGSAVADISGIWTDFWCSAGPTRTHIQIPVRDATDPAIALKVNVRFVIHPEGQSPFDMDNMNVQSSSSPFELQFGPYPGPNPAFAYNNTIDMVVTASDRAGNKTVRKFGTFLTLNDCKATPNP